MEVHPPHEPVHSWREALIHIGLMTVGLFIALSLEGLIEYVHHKHLVREARENIHRELEDNHSAQQNIVHLQHSGDLIQTSLATLSFIEGHRDAKHQQLGFSLEFNDLSDAAWRSARDTGALGYMPLSEVQTYASIYGLQATVTEEAMHLVTHQAEALAPIFATGAEPDFQKMPASDFEQMRQASGTNYADVYVLQQLVKGLDQQYTKELQAQ